MALANEIERRTFFEVYNLCCLQFHRLNQYMYIPGLYSYEVIIIFIIITITRFFNSVELLVYSNVFKTPISKRMLNLCQIGSKNATTRTFFK